MKKTALITGASRGIGRAVALRLKADGFRVIAHYHRERGKALEVSDWVVQADLSDVGGIDGMFAALNGVRLDVLVNNAGVWKGSPLGATEAARMHELVDTNLKGPFWVMNRAVALLNDGGRVVNVSSVAAQKAVGGGRSLYGATKAALDAMTRNWSLELAGRGILVNGVAPGYVETDMTAAHLSDAGIRKHAVERHPLGRLGTVEDVAEVVAWLCSSGAGFVTGQTINASGGFYL